MRKIIFVSSLFLLLIACNNPLSKPYKEATVKEDLKEIIDSKKLSEDDAKMLLGYIMLAKLGNKNIEGKTYKELLEEAKKIKKENEDKAAEEEKEHADKRERLGKVFTATMIEKGYETLFGDYLYFDIRIENKTDKDIRAVKGAFQISDLFDAKIKGLNIVEDDVIPAHSIDTITYTIDYNKYKDDHVTLRNKDMDDLKIVWNPEKIIFADGTTLE